MEQVTASDVQLRYTTLHGPLLRSDGRTAPTTLDDIERLFGEYVLNSVLENQDRWVDVTTPQGVGVSAKVNGRDYAIHVVTAEAIPADFLVDADARTITIPINAPMFALVDAINTAAQHEPQRVPVPAPAVTPGAAPTTTRCRCWTREANQIGVIIHDRRKFEFRWRLNDPANTALINKIVDAQANAWKHANGQPPSGKAFVDLTEDELTAVYRYEADDKRRDVQMAKPGSFVAGGVEVDRALHGSRNVPAA